MRSAIPQGGVTCVLLLGGCLAPSGVSAAKPGYIGVWASSAKACRADPHETEDIAIRYRARSIDGNEWSCRIGRVRAVPRGWRVRLSCSIEGTSYTRNVLWRVGPNGLRESEGSASRTYVRCKDADYKVRR